MTSKTPPLTSEIGESARIFSPRDMVQVVEPEGLQDAKVTRAPKRVSTSVIHAVSISSEPSAMGTRILGAEKVDAELAEVDMDNLLDL